MKNTEIITYISTYGCKCIYPGRGIPIEVGAEGRNEYLYQTLDNTGNNISSENEYYGDLTALYWIWKNGNLQDYKYIYFRHYNKFLLVKGNIALRFLKKYQNGWVVAKVEKNPPHNYLNEWECFCDIIKDRYSFYYPVLKEIYDIKDGSGFKCNVTNMFITSAKQMNEYCKVLFDICKDLRNRIGITEHDKYDQRYCAFMAERFLTIYIRSHNLPRLEVTVYRGKWYLNTIERIAKIIGINKNNQIVRRIRKRMYKNSYKSSYRDIQ